MLAKMQARVEKWDKELKDNGGIVPASWIPILDDIKLICELIGFFRLLLPKQVCEALDAIIAAINLAEQNSTPA